jgi:WD domain, G-beta repeat/GAF domain/PEGA domain
MPRDSSQVSIASATLHDFIDVQSREEIELGEIERTIHENRDRPLSSVLKGVIEQVRSLTDAEGALIALCDVWGVVCRASAGEAPEVGSKLQSEPSLTRKCIESGQLVVCEDTEEEFRIRLSARIRLRSVVVVPIHGQGSVLGVVEVLSSRAAAFTAEHVDELQRIAQSLVPLLQREEPVETEVREEEKRAWIPVAAAALLLGLLGLWFELYQRPRNMASATTHETSSPLVQPDGRLAAGVSTSAAEGSATSDASLPALVIEETPPGAQIFIDDKLVTSTKSTGEADVSSLSPGRYRLRITAPGYQDYEKGIDLLAGQTSKIALKLEPLELPRPPETVTGASLPVSATNPGSLSVPEFVPYRTLKAHSGWVTGLAFSADGERLASGSSDQTVKFWDVSTGQEANAVASKINDVQALAFSRDGRWLAAENSSNAVTVWNATTGQEVRTLSSNKASGALSSWVYSIAFSPDSRWLASGVDDKTVRLWDVATGQPIRDLTAGHRSVIYVAFSPDGRWLASGGDGQTIKIWEAATGQELGTLRGHKKDVYAVVFSPNGRYLASASADQTVKLWDVTTGREIHTLTGHGSDVTSIAFSPDSRWLASGSWDKTIKIWDVQTGQEVRTLTGYDHHIYTVAFDSHGRWLASGGEDGTIKLWRLGPH